MVVASLPRETILRSTLTKLCGGVTTLDCDTHPCHVSCLTSCMSALHNFMLDLCPKLLTQQARLSLFTNFISQGLALTSHTDILTYFITLLESEVISLTKGEIV